MGGKEGGDAGGRAVNRIRLRRLEALQSQSPPSVGSATNAWIAREWARAGAIFPDSEIDPFSEGASILADLVKAMQDAKGTP